MLFNVEFDRGNVIEGYLVPDGFAEQPRIAVFDGTQALAELDCAELRDAVRTSGRHASGMVGFRLDDTVIPGLADRKHLTIRDARSGLLVYRRGDQGWKPRRIVRLEMQMVPSVALDKALEPHFQYAVTRVERYGLETALQVFHLDSVKSIYLSGKLQIRSFEHFLERGFEVVALLPEPYYQMAESILFLKRFPTFPKSLFGPRDALVLGPAAEHFAEVDLNSAKSLRAALKSLDPATARLMKAPLTRQLTTTLSDEEPDRNSVAAALDIMSRFAVTGLRMHPETFVLPVAELLAIEPHSLPVADPHSAISAVADLLRDIPQAELLLELDLVIYHFASQAIASGMAQQPLPAYA